MKYGAAAFTTIELLIALTVVLVIITPMNMLLSNLHYLKYDSLQTMEDEISLQQLRLYLANAEDIDIEDNCLLYNSLNEEKQLCLVNQKLISQPGTLVFISNIDSISFRMDSSTVYIKYCRKGVCYEKWLGFN